MARISGVELQDDWKVDYGLTNIKGVGWSLSQKILKAAGISANKRVSELTSEEISKISSKLEEHPIEGELARQVRRNIARLQTIGTYRGSRHSKGLPVRGQRTRSNARTKRGKRKTVGAFRKKALIKIQQQKKAKDEEE